DRVELRSVGLAGGGARVRPGAAGLAGQRRALLQPGADLPPQRPAARGPSGLRALARDQPAAHREPRPRGRLGARGRRARGAPRAGGGGARAPAPGRRRRGPGERGLARTDGGAAASAGPPPGGARARAPRPGPGPGNAMTAGEPRALRRLLPLLVGLVALAVRAAFLLGIEAYPKFELIRNRLDDQFFLHTWAL